MAKKDWKPRICTNSLCKKEFTCENWRPNRYCSHICSVLDPKRVNVMKGSSLKDVLINKYGETEGLLRYAKAVSGQSVNMSKYLQSMSIEERKKLRGRPGGRNGMHGVTVLQKWTEKFGADTAALMMNKYSVALSNSNKGRKHSNETISKIRVSKINRLNNQLKGGLSPRYNPTACKIIEDVGSRFGYNFQHAENGGEVHVKGVGCFLDGYDKLKNTVIEFYERFHYDSLGNLKPKDLRREELIIDKLKCSFIRINAFDKNNIKIEVAA